MMTKVIRDIGGNIINIGEWDYKISPVKNPEIPELNDDLSNMSDDEIQYQMGLVWAWEIYCDSMKEKGLDPNHLHDEDGNVITRVTNPLPDGSTQSDEIVDMLDDGSLVVASDYVTKRRLKYPGIADQLDYIYHNGVAAWKTMIKKIKDNNPK